MESICYILMDVLSNGNFLSDVSPKDYQQEKGHIDLLNLGRTVPEIFQRFYHYVLSLNCSDEVNFFIWRTELYELISKSLYEPYGWMLSKNYSQSSLKEKLRREHDQ